MADDRQPAENPVPQPYFEPIGLGESGLNAGGSTAAEDDDGVTRPGGQAFVQVLAAGAADWRDSLRSLRFWTVAVGTSCTTWAVVAYLVWVTGPAAGDLAGWVPVPQVAYALAAALLPAAAALLGIHWGISGWRSAAAAERGGMMVSLLAAGLRGLVFAALVLVSLLVQAAVSGGPAAVALSSAGLASVEAVLFGAVGAAAAAVVRRVGWAAAAAWGVGVFLVGGTLVAAVLLLPTVRADEPVTVALNVQRSADGTPIAYECSRIPAGTVEVYRTERIMWLPAMSPAVVLVMLAGEPGAGQELLGWLATELRNAATGPPVPCVNGEPRTTDAPPMPLAAAGLLLQGAVAGALLGGAHMATSRRRHSV